jgi:hypothetical protein
MNNICVVCKKSFEPKRKNNIYCSPICKRHARWLREVDRYGIDHFRKKNSENFQKHKVKRDSYRRKYYQDIRIEVLTHYGNGKCACVQCGENRFPCLTLDHINNDGKQDRELYGCGVNFYKRLKRTGFPLGIQTLCMNCQIVKQNTFRPVNQAPVSNCAKE